MSCDQLQQRRDWMLHQRPEGCLQGEAAFLSVNSSERRLIVVLGSDFAVKN